MYYSTMGFSLNRSTDESLKEELHPNNNVYDDNLTDREMQLLNLFELEVKHIYNKNSG